MGEHGRRNPDDGPPQRRRRLVPHDGWRDRGDGSIESNTFRLLESDEPWFEVLVDLSSGGPLWCEVLASSDGAHWEGSAHLESFRVGHTCLHARPTVRDHIRLRLGTHAPVASLRGVEVLAIENDQESTASAEGAEGA